MTGHRRSPPGPAVVARRVIEFALLLGGCVRADAPGSFAVTDSAGVRVSTSADARRVFAEVDPDPLVSLGGPEAVGPTQFSGLRGVHIDRAGNLWVVDGTSAEVRLFRPDGSHWKTVGGSGEGPGEFRRPRLLGAFRGDSVAIWDDALARLTILDDTAGVGRIATARPTEGPAPHPYAAFGDGRLLALIPRVLEAGALAPGTVLRDTTRLVRLDLASMRFEHMAEREGAQWLWTGRDQVPIPFTISAAVAVDGDVVHVARGPDFTVRVFDGGRLAETYGVARSPREVGGGEVASYESYIGRFVPESRRPGHLSALHRPERPRLLPAYSRLLVAGDGAIWAQVYDPDPLEPATWDVYDGDRRRLGQVRTPGSFRPERILGDALVGVWLDDLDVEHVRIYRLSAPSIGRTPSKEIP